MKELIEISKEEFELKQGEVHAEYDSSGIKYLKGVE